MRPFQKLHQSLLLSPPLTFSCWHLRVAHLPCIGEKRPHLCGASILSGKYYPFLQCTASGKTLQRFRKKLHICAAWHSSARSSAAGCLVYLYLVWNLYPSRERVGGFCFCLLFYSMKSRTIGLQLYSRAKFEEGSQACAVIYQNCWLFNASGLSSDFIKDMRKRIWREACPEAET